MKIEVDEQGTDLDAVQPFGEVSSVLVWITRKQPIDLGLSSRDRVRIRRVQPNVCQHVFGI
jgi:hypothetical protein